jgi:hypothetical protein
MNEYRIKLLNNSNLTSVDLSTCFYFDFLESKIAMKKRKQKNGNLLLEKPKNIVFMYQY